MMVDPEKKQYMTMTEEDAKQMQAMMGPMMERMKQQRQEAAAAGKVTFAKTGKTETVAGVPCEVYRGEYIEEDGDKDQGEACVATGVGFALDAADVQQPHGAALAAPATTGCEQFRDLVAGNKGILKAKSFKDGKLKTEHGGHQDRAKGAG